MWVCLVSKTIGMEKKEKSRNTLVFAVNGERIELFTIDPSTTLLDFLRSISHFKSVKSGCGEGGCGACVVVLSKYDPLLDRVEDFTVSSCLTLLCSVNRCSITTSEGLGNSKDGFHPIHERFAGFHASQCGFCTPGMCVSLFSALANAEKTNRPEPPPGFSKLTVSEAEKAVAGNLCRCTGYRPIADVCKSFAADVDIEDLGFNTFWKKEDGKEVKISRLPLYDRKNDISTFPEFLKKEVKSVMVLDCEKYHWYTPVSVNELQRLLGADEMTDGSSTKIVVGNTGMGYYKDHESHDRYIDLKYIPELSIVKRDQTGIEIGAAVTISKTIETLRDEINGEYFPKGDGVLKCIANHLEKVASGFVRNSASIGGNLVMASRCFPSDIATILLGVDATVEVMTGHRTEKLAMEEFLAMPLLGSETVLLSVKIPYWRPITDASPETNTKLLFETYRASPRPLGNALPYLNAFFLAQVSLNNNSDGAVVNTCRLAFGAYGTKHAIRAREVENFLSGKVLTAGVLREAVKLVRAIVLPEDGTSHPAYRSSLAVSYIFQFFASLIDDIEFNDESVPTLLSPAKQVIELAKGHRPVGDPIAKTGAALQASGEAIYVDDIPSPPNCLHGAFIYSTKPLARVKGVNFQNERLPDGVIAVVSANDIPDSGENIGAETVFGAEPLFADDLAQCAGQNIAFVVADTQKRADMAANSAVVDYDMENLELPILSVEDAVERSSLFEVPPYLYPEQVGDLSKGMAAADHKILSAKIKLGSQYYFYMETQTALAVPDEDNCMVVYSSTQSAEFAHMSIAKCLGVPEHNVRVITRRVGGGFGGKGVKSICVATACAVAAQKLRRPVRVYLNRKTDMIMVGGRHPMEITYSVGFKSNGKVTALQLDILVNAGIFPDLSILIPTGILATLRKYDWGALSFDIKVCKTNLPSRSAMRAPGELQGSYIAEAVIEHVASTLSMEVDSVRRINLHTYNSLSLFYAHCSGEAMEYTLPSIWDKLADSSFFHQRREMIKQFNRDNTWHKRGIARVPVIHEVTLRATPGRVSILRDGSVSVEVGGIEIGQGLWTKVKQMAAFGLSLINLDGKCDLLEKVRVVQSDTLSLTQNGFTGGSTTSESSCAAVRLCCNILVERLTPLKVQLQEQTGFVTWEMLIFQAHSQSVNLSAGSYYVPDNASVQYLNYGAAVSEVEIDLLTGATSVLQTDIMYDCGESLNPAVDLGQIEGGFAQGVGFFMLEEYLTNSDGLVTTDDTWTYKIPTIDTVPKQLNVEILKSGHHKNRILSSKASGEPPLVLAASVHCATREAVKAARDQLLSWDGLEKADPTVRLSVPATMPVVKEACGMDIVERYLKWTMGGKKDKYLGGLYVTISSFSVDLI